MKLPRLYSDLSWLWSRLSPPEGYAEEAAALLERFEERLGRLDGKGTRRPSLLELGVGGGHNLSHLVQTFDCTAVDLSEAMLASCRKLVPQARTVHGDLRTLRLGERFDAVLLHDAADYLLTPQDARAALETARVHLKPGGALLLAPTYTRETFLDGESATDQPEEENLDLAYLSYVHDPDPSDSTYETILVYIIRDPDTRQVQVVEDRHQCGLFSAEEWLTWLGEAGFDAELTDDEMAWTLFSASAV